jgi:hypothetical protein
MPRKPTPGMVQIAVEIPQDIHARLVERCERLYLKKSDEVRLALRRHLDHPPADVSPPLPDAVLVLPKKPAAGGAKKRRKT